MTTRLRSTRPHKYSCSVILSATLALLCCTADLRASIVLVDNFNYTNGALTAVWGSPWSAHSAAGLSPVTVANGEIRLVGDNNAEDVSAPLAGAPYNTNSPAVLYAAFQVRFTALPTDAGTYITHFRDPGFIYPCRIYASTLNASSGCYRLGVGIPNSSPGYWGELPQDLALNTSYLLVVRFALSNSLSTIWLNPSAETDAGVSAAASSDRRATGVDSFAFRQAAGGGTCYLDNLRVGDSFADVISANNPPTITSIGNQSIVPGTSTAPLAFAVGDVETPVSNLVVSAQSADPGLVPESSLVLSGSGTNRTLVATPLAEQHGTTVITVRVTDDGGTTTLTTFRLLVGMPTVSCIPSQSIVSNTTTGPVSFTVADPAVSLDALRLTASSSNTNLAPTNRIVLGGSGFARTVLVSPQPRQCGVARITVTASDGNAEASSSFLVTVRPQLGRLIDEPFAYADGTVLAAGSTPWASFSGTAGQTEVLGGKVFLSQDNNEGLSRSLGPFFPTNGVVLFASFKVAFSQRPTTVGNPFAHFGGACLVYASSSGAPAGQVRLGVSQNSKDPSYVALHPTSLPLGSEHTAVVRYDVGTQESTLWIDPVSDLSPSVTAPTGFLALRSVNSFVLEQQANIGALTVDEVKVGTSFADVMASPASPDTRLVIHPRCDGGLEVVWQAELAGYKLQRALDLPGSWQDFTNQGAVLDTHKVLVLYEPLPAAFFRLHKP